MPRSLAAALIERGLEIISGGTDSHVMLVDLRPRSVDRQARRDRRSDRAGITCNKNGIPFDPEKPTITSGIRLGSPAGTTRGFGAAEFREIGHLIADVLDGLAKNGERQRPGRGAGAAARSQALTGRFPDLPR